MFSQLQQEVGHSVPGMNRGNKAETRTDVYLVPVSLKTLSPRVAIITLSILHPLKNLQLSGLSHFSRSHSYYMAEKIFEPSLAEPRDYVLKPLLFETLFRKRYVR